MLEFTKIKKQEIFNSDFLNMTENNKITFLNTNLCVIYAPNGVGKSSLCSVLNGEGEFSVIFEGTNYTNTNCNLFHVILDQNNRNIIGGVAKDYLLGDNIAREFELKEWLDNKILDIYNNLKSRYKDELGITKKTDKRINWFPDNNREFIKNIVNRSNNADAIDKDYLVQLVQSIEEKIIEEYDIEKLNFFKDESNCDIINQILEIREIIQNEEIKNIEQYDDAIDILSKYQNLTTCIVCDTENINCNNLLNEKQDKKNTIINNLDRTTKNILNNIINKISETDPFDIKNILIQSIALGNDSLLTVLINNLKEYKSIYVSKSNNFIFTSIDSTFIEKYDEYKQMLNSELNFTSEDLLFIEELIEKNINKNISLMRENNKITIKINDDYLLGTERKDLKLSSGEQNFISLAFELLKAKNMPNEFIVIDDPISSFDSIFKNKLVFSIIKILSDKKTILLSHNMDLIRLITYQTNKGFELFLFNNYENQINGFINVPEKEKKLMISIPELLDFFRKSDIDSEIKDEKMFVLSLIPFMRGYFNFIADKENKNKLTKLMHGYEQTSVKLNEIYKTVFSKDLNNNYELSVDDILSIDLDLVEEIINKENYPLLNRVLINNFTYLYLRLKTEKVLVNKYHITIGEHTDQLSGIINAAFSTSNNNDIKNRIFFFSKKTLLNEFNHFDGNMNIYQPAIDISENILNKEKNDILNKLNEL